MIPKNIRAEIVLTTLKQLFPTIRCALSYSNGWELLVAVMLSAQCTDKQVNVVTKKLFAMYPQFQDYLSVNQQDFEKSIYATGFYRQKAKNILATARMVQDQFGGKIPQSMNELLLLPGVARKTANVVLGELYGISIGIAVDTHVCRLARLYGLTEYDDPAKIENDLMMLLPQKEWREFTLRMIEYGRRYCPARKHNHTECPITQGLDAYQAQP